MNTGLKIAAAAAVLSTAALYQDAQAKVNVNINLGAPVIVSSPAPVVVERHGPRRFVVDSRPRFLYTPSLGFYVSVGAPYDIIYYRDRYYIHDDGEWYRSSNYGGPWVIVRQGRVPGRITRYRHEDIRHHRDQEYRRAQSWERRDRPDERNRSDRDRRRDDDRPRWR